MTLEHDAVRAKVIETTLALMDEGGLENIKARTLAKRVGVSVGTIYNLFGNVDRLIQEVNSHILANMNAYGQNGVAKCETELANKLTAGQIKDNRREKVRFRLFALANNYMDFVEANANRWSAMLAYNRNLADESEAGWYVTQKNSMFDLIGNVLIKTELGKDPQTRMTAARALWSSVHGIVTMSYVGQVSEKTRAHTWAQIELLVNTFVDGMKFEAAEG